MTDYVVYANSGRLSHDEWLELRKGGLGGSDAGAIMGVNPYKDSFSVWADKLGKLPPLEDTEAMRQGRDLEDYVAKRFSEKTGLTVHRNRMMLRSKAHPCMVANIDRQITGKRAGLECKTCRDIRMTRYRNGEVPMEYYCQCLHYMAVTGWDEWFLAVLVYGTDLLVYNFRRDDPDVKDDMEALVSAEEAFWRDHMEGGIVPPTTGLESTTKALGAVWPQSDGLTEDADEETDEMIRECVELRAKKKDIEAALDEVENRIKRAMGETETLRGASGKVSWKTVSQKRFDEKLLKKAYPQVDVDMCKKESASRRFSVSAPKEDE